MKIYAFFLPQFHTIPENDAWWGKGFTEWVNVKAARPLFRGHRQPVHPLNNRYYNLLSRETVEWQTELLNRYGLDGFIYYHYYFDGKLLLEKPAENLLRWKDIDQHFFFCWANHPWQKTWNGGQEILMPMDYGDEESWEKHFQYLLTFFNDDRYEKVDNMPIFMLLKSGFEEKKQMFSFFDRRCREEGFAGLYLIESFNGIDNKAEFESSRSAVSKRVFYREPLIQLRSYQKHIPFSERISNKLLRIRNKLLAHGRKDLPKVSRLYSGNSMMKYKLQHEPMGSDVAHGLWFEWDNTPRHKERGFIIKPFQKKYFNKYMDLIKDEEYLFINAWNEWCEGMILEPTEEKGYRYLEWIKAWREREQK